MPRPRRLAGLGKDLKRLARLPAALLRACPRRSTFAFASGRLVHRIGERLPSVIGIVVHILGLLFFMVAFEHGLGSVIAAALIAGAGMGLVSPALTVVVQNSVPVDRMGSATTSQQFIR